MLYCVFNSNVYYLYYILQHNQSALLIMFECAFGTDITYLLTE